MLDRLDFFHKLIVVLVAVFHAWLDRGIVVVAIHIHKDAATVRKEVVLASHGRSILAWGHRQARKLSGHHEACLGTDSMGDMGLKRK